MSAARKPYPTDVTDDEWAFAAPYLALIREDAPQREHDLRAVFNALRWVVKAGCSWRLLPRDFPPWEAVYQQARRWLAAGVFEAMAHDLRAVPRVAAGRDRRRRSSTGGRSSPPRRAAAGPGTTGTSGARARRSTWRWTPSATCWR
jgi:transposase